MRIGALRHRVTIQSIGRTQDPVTGELLEGWTEFKKVYARVEPLSAREFIAAQQANSEVSARITIRYRDDLTESMRIVHRGKIYDIQGLLPDAKSGLNYLTIPVKEGVSDGGNG